MKGARTFGLALLGLLLATPPGFAAVLDFTSPVTVAHGGDWPDIDQDGSGGLHLSYLKGDGVHHLRYSGGAWGGDELVPGTWEASQTGRWNPPRVTGQGAQAHVLWGEYSFNNNQLHLHSRQGGTWSQHTITGWIEYSDLQLDARGAVNVVYFDLQGEMGMYHWAFQGGQPVVVRQQVAEGDYRYPVLTRGPGNQIQMATRFRHLHSASMYPSYAWSEMDTCGDIGGDSAGTPSIDVGPGGETQTAWTVWTSSGGWKPAAVYWMDTCGAKVQMSETPLRHDHQIENAENAALAVDDAGNRLVSWSDNSVGGRLHYNYYSVTQGSWSGDRLLPDAAPNGIRPCLEPAGTGRFHLVWQGDDGRILHCLATDAGAPPPDPGFILAGNYGVRASASELPVLTVVCAADGGDRGEVERVELLMEGLPGGLPLARLPNGLYALLAPLPGGVGPGERLDFQLRAMDAAGLELLRWPELSAR